MLNFANPNFIVPTAPTGDSSNQAASTEFVAIAVGGGGGGGLLASDNVWTGTNTFTNTAEFTAAFTVSNGTPATSPTAAGLVVTGGIGAGKGIWALGNSGSGGGEAYIFDKVRDATNAWRTTVGDVGGLISDTAGGFWRGFHFACLGITDPVGGATLFPRMSVFYELDSYTAPSTRNFVLDMGNVTATSLFTFRARSNGTALFSADTATFTIHPTTVTSSATTGALVVGGGIGVGGSIALGDAIFSSNGAAWSPYIDFTNTGTDADAPASISFNRSRAGGALNVNDRMGAIIFKGMDTAPELLWSAHIIAKATARGSGFVVGSFEFGLLGADPVAIFSTATSAYPTNGDSFFNIPFTSASTSKTTGALTVAGGIGVAGQLTAGGIVVDGTTAAVLALKTTGSGVPDLRLYDTTDGGWIFFSDNGLLYLAKADTAGAWTANALAFGTDLSATFNGNIFVQATAASVTLQTAGSNNSSFTLYDTTDGGWTMYQQDGVLHFAKTNTSGSWVADAFEIGTDLSVALANNGLSLGGHGWLFYDSSNVNQFYVRHESGGLTIDFNAGADLFVLNSVGVLTVASNIYAAAGTFLVGSDAGGGIEFGVAGAGGTPYFDWHSSASVTDFDARISATGGTASDGQGILTFTAADFVFNGDVTINGALVSDSFDFSGTLSLSPTISNTGAAVAALTIDPSTGVNMGIQAITDGTGTLTGGYIHAFNQFKVNSDDINAGSTFVTGFVVEHYFGGSAMRGGREAFAAYAYQTTNSTTSNTNKNYVGVTGVGTGLDNDGGTSTSAANARGAIFGGGFVAALGASATNWLDVCGVELNTALVSGSSSYFKTMLRLCGRSDDDVQGANVDCMMHLGNQTGAVSWDYGFYFGATSVGHDWPLQSGGTIFFVPNLDSPSCAYGIDFRNVTFTSAAFASNQFLIGQNGAISTQLIYLAQGSTSLSNGLNSNIADAGTGYIRISGPTGAFSLGGFQGGAASRLLYVFNSTSQAMTIINQSGSSTAANRILTLTGADVTLRTGTSFASFIYDGTAARWVLMAIN